MYVAEKLAPGGGGGCRTSSRPEPSVRRSRTSGSLARVDPPGRRVGHDRASISAKEGGRLGSDGPGGRREDQPEKSPLPREPAVDREVAEPKRDARAALVRQFRPPADLGLRLRELGPIRPVPDEPIDL